MDMRLIKFMKFACHHTIVFCTSFMYVIVINWVPRNNGSKQPIPRAHPREWFVYVAIILGKQLISVICPAMHAPCVNACCCWSFATKL